MNTTDRKLTSENESPSATGAVVGGVTGGVAAGAVTGALAGGVTGPVGAAIGAVTGAVVGAFMGKEKADPLAEDVFWRDNFSSRPYVDKSASYDDYGPAYRHGVEAHTRYPDRHFDEIESDLGRDWSSSRGKSSLEWERAKHASRDGWSRVKDAVERAVPGDSDRDGK